MKELLERRTKALRTLGYKDALGVKAAVAVVLGQRLQKSKSVTTSNWAMHELSPKQLQYAANDAFAALAIFCSSPAPARAERTIRLRASRLMRGAQPTSTSVCKLAP